MYLIAITILAIIIVASNLGMAFYLMNQEKQHGETLKPRSDIHLTQSID